MPLVDTHCHLDVAPLADDLAGVLERARAVAVTRIVAPAYDLASWDAVAALGDRPGVHLAFGLHPWRAEEPLDPAALRARLRGPRVVAVGEIGLDFKVEAAPARQLEVLRLQLDLARDLDLPVLLHCRGAFEELLAALAPHAGALRGVVHAFSRGPDLARRFVDLGLHVAFGGAVTRRNANRARAAAAAAPLERIVLETDAPSIGLDVGDAAVPPERVEPRHVADVARSLAAIRGVPVEAVAAATTANAERLFRLE